jgi:glycosyltransferase involved in cell wall biosynthesis
MVQVLLSALGASTDSPITVYHVDARLSDSVQDIGLPRIKKLLVLLRYCAAAIYHRFRHGVTNFYFVPAHGNRASVYRDWLVMAMCRPFFKRITYHWHAAGMGEWLTRNAKGWERWVSKRLIYCPDLSIVLGNANRADAEILESRRIIVVPNGIPDPCQRFEEEVLPMRLARAKARTGGGEKIVFQILFLGICYRPKGLFDLLDAMAVATRQLKDSRFRLHLRIAGSFWLDSERREFEERLKNPDLTGSVQYMGFVASDQKLQLLRESDCLAFPSYYEAESFGLVLLEAMAHGLPIIATHWRAIPEILPAGYEGIVDPRSPDQIARAITALLQRDYDPRLRIHFVERFTDQQFAARMKVALQTVTTIANSP